ncbi:hypothetical protein [Candidatus Alkanophaga liquidiphilum]|nr:hypothetical protein [Candidatus Alkanophaga liquidiphilum]RLG39191.1 MAG: hypothetical protein DRN91_00485 [Candidatus Alkanophagales archaeon]
MKKIFAAVFIAVLVLCLFSLLSVSLADEFPDSDGDGIPDVIDVDSDGDGLPDLVEFVVGTDPFDETSVVYIEDLAEFVQQILENTTIETTS